MLTKQQIFTKVHSHLLTQNAKCIHPSTGKCCYRLGDDGEYWMLEYENPYINHI